MPREQSYCINLCSELGTLTAKGFVKNEDRCLRSLKKLRKEINLDQKDEENDTVLLLGELGVLKDMLIPLAMKYGQSDSNLLTQIAKLVVQMTFPPEAHDRQHKKRFKHLREMKACFLQKGALSSFTRLLEETLEAGVAGKNDKQKTVVELILYLIKNLLVVPDVGKQGQVSGSSAGTHMQTLHDDFLNVLHQEYATEVLLFLGEYVGKENNRDWNLVLLEVYFNIFRGTNAEELVEGITSTSCNKDKTTSEMIASKLKPKNRKVSKFNQDDKLRTALVSSRTKRVKANRIGSSRHSRFGGLLKRGGGDTSARSQVIGNVFDALAISKGAQTDLNQVKKKKSTGRRKETHKPTQQQKMAQEQRSLNKSTIKMLGKLCKSFIERCYKPLFTALIRDFRREDNRLEPDDQTRYLWLSSFCMQFQRLYSEKAVTETSEYDWSKSPIFVTMDLWSFNYVIKSCQSYYDQKIYSGTEISVKTLKEMLLVLNGMSTSNVEECKKLCTSLRNSVFYDVEELEIVTRVLRQWDESNISWKCLYDLSFLMDGILKVVKTMASEGAVVRARSRGNAGKKSKKKKEKEWSIEEMNALEEMAKECGGETLKAFRVGLKNTSFASVFDPSRTPKMLRDRWAQVVASGKNVTDFLSEEMESANAGSDNDSVAGDEGDEEESRVKQAKNKEIALQEEPWFRRVVYNNAIQNLCALIDPSRIPNECYNRDDQLHDIISCFLLRIHEASPASLWHISLLDVYKRRLRVACSNSLSVVLRKIVKSFFKHAEKNPLVYVEILFWRNKTENTLIDNFYENAERRREKKMREENALADAYRARKAAELQREMDEDEEEFNGSNVMNAPRVRKDADSNSTSDLSEEEAEFDGNVKTNTENRNPNPPKKIKEKPQKRKKKSKRYEKLNPSFSDSSSSDSSSSSDEEEKEIVKRVQARKKEADRKTQSKPSDSSSSDSSSSSSDEGDEKKEGSGNIRTSKTFQSKHTKRSNKSKSQKKTQNIKSKKGKLQSKTKSSDDSSSSSSSSSESSSDEDSTNSKGNGTKKQGISAKAPSENKNKPVKEGKKSETSGSSGEDGSEIEDRRKTKRMRIKKRTISSSSEDSQVAGNNNMEIVKKKNRIKKRTISSSSESS